MNYMTQSDRRIDDRLPAVADDWNSGLPVGYPGTVEGELDSMQMRGRLALLWLLDVVLKHKWLIAVVCLLSIACGVIKTYLTTPIYEAATTIQIDQQAPKVLNTKQQASEDFSREPFFFQTQYELLRSRSLAERVAKNLDPADIAAMRRPATSSLLSRLRQRFTGAPAQPVDEAPLSADAIEAQRASAAGMIMGGLSIKPVPMTRIVSIAFDSTSPAVAQKVSNAVADSFVASTLDRRVSASAYARTFFEERLQQLKLKLEDSEKQVVAYARREGIANVDERQPELDARLTSINTALSAATTERIHDEELWTQAKAGNGLGLPQVMADRAVQSARDKRAQLMTDYQDKLNLLKPAFPEMVQLRSQISELDRQIRAQVELVKESIRAQFEAAKAQEKSLTTTLADLRNQSLDLRTRSIQYNILQRELDTNKALYDGLLQQYKEVGIAAGLGTNNVSIVDRADRPAAPISPRLSKNILVALIFGLIGSSVIVYVLEVLDDTFKGVENIEETLGLTALGIIPLAESESLTMLDGVLAQPQSPVAEAYRSLRTALQFSTETGVPKVLFVTSAKPGEGKSTTSIMLAANFAQLGLRVLLIDADLRNPSLNRYLKTDNRAGLSNYLASGAELPEITQGCSIENLALITAGPLPPNPAELLAGPKLSVLLSRTSELYDMILIDGPPVMGLADAPILASIAAGTLLVIQADTTRRGLVRAAVKRLRFARARMVGTVLNKFNANRSGYTYRYSYNYDYSYRSPNQAIDAATQPRLAEIPRV